ncbi:hypothetical protein, partial [Azospirillum sp.]|uniref:hypothetical protein n=1 Tax=Azospirillum sp. TaxID=34012 RepID=UPI002D3D4636
MTTINANAIRSPKIFVTPWYSPHRTKIDAGANTPDFFVGKHAEASGTLQQPPRSSKRGELARRHRPMIFDLF